MDVPATLGLNCVPGDCDEIHTIRRADRAKMWLDDGMQDIVTQILIDVNGMAQTPGSVSL